MSDQDDLLSDMDYRQKIKLSDKMSWHIVGVSDNYKSGRTMSDGRWQSESLDNLLEDVTALQASSEINNVILK